MDLTTLTDAEARDLLARVYADVQRRDTIAQAPAQAEALAATYAAAVASTDPVAWAVVPDAIGPGVAVTWTDGNRWRNKSGTWLPKTASPGTYPMGWTQETGLPTASAWSGASVAYKVGDLVTYSGVVYRCLQAHTSQAGWNPSAVPALWTRA